MSLPKNLSVPLRSVEVGDLGGLPEQAQLAVERRRQQQGVPGEQRSGEEKARSADDVRRSTGGHAEDRQLKHQRDDDQWDRNELNDVHREEDVRHDQAGRDGAVLVDGIGLEPLQ